MTDLNGIPIHVEGTNAEEGETIGGWAGGVRAILYEIEGLLKRFAETGEAGAIDLRSLPMAPGDYERLQEFLGEGELDAQLDALGPTRVRETAFSGVWWVSHRNAHGETLTEIIEVTRVPEILCTDEEAIRESAAQLSERLVESRNPSTTDESYES